MNMPKITNVEQGKAQIKLIAKRAIRQAVNTVLEPAVKEGKYNVLDDQDVEKIINKTAAKMEKKILELIKFCIKNREKA